MEDFNDIKALAFWNLHDFSRCFGDATVFAGDHGRIADMSDIVAARIDSGRGTEAWNNYFTTLTAEYCGFSRGGNKIIIVAHSLGPLSTLDGIVDAYEEAGRGKFGGRISAEEFLRLESGYYGEVEIVDVEQYMSKSDLAFYDFLHNDQLATDELFRARVGPRWQEYLAKMIVVDEEFRDENYHGDQRPWFENYLCQLGHNGKTPYKYFPKEKDTAIAHILTMGRLMNMGHHIESRRRHINSLMHEIDPQDNLSSSRLVGLRPGWNEKDIVSAPEARWLIKHYWPELVKTKNNHLLASLVSNNHMKKPDKRIYELYVTGEKWYTQHEDDGVPASEIEYPVIDGPEPISDAIEVSLPVTGYPGIMHYRSEQLVEWAPKGANAYYFVSAPELERDSEGKHVHRIQAAFFRVRIDKSKRIPREEEIKVNRELYLELINRYFKENP